MLKSMLRSAALAGALVLPSTALAVPAMVTADLNVRAGPGTQHQRIGTIPNRSQVQVRGCLRDFNWCRVNWRGPTGWVSGRYLAHAERGFRRAPLPQIGLSLGIPIIRFGAEAPPPRWRDRDRRRGPPPRFERDRRGPPPWARRGPPPWSRN